AAMTETAIKRRVHSYFSDTTKDYLKYYGTRKHHHMHYGFDRDLPVGSSPTGHMSRYLARIAGLLPGVPGGAVPRVLDAGCGMGGSSILLAREAGALCVGINLVEGHARIAKAFAQADAAKWGTPRETPHGVAPVSPGLDRTPARFAANDYTTPAFKPASFDVIWALESFCYAPDKEAWIRAMALLLKAG